MQKTTNVAERIGTILMSPIVSPGSSLPRPCQQTPVQSNSTRSWESFLGNHERCNTEVIF
eukprot:1079276-Rhodomonas_salina.2